VILMNGLNYFNLVLNLSSKYYLGMISNLIQNYFEQDFKITS
jgi:hypothetical protein